MLQQPAAEIRKDAEGLLRAVGSLSILGFCCINMDAGTLTRTSRHCWKPLL
jgi:hypothetical protein